MITIPVSYKPSAFALMLMEVVAAPDTQSARTGGTPAQDTPPSLTNGLSPPIIEALATIGAIVTSAGTQVTATSESAGSSASETQTSVSIISATTVRTDLNLRDLCNMEAVLTGNTKGVVRPCVGASKVVDALMQLATGPDVALAVAAREFLPEIASAKDGAGRPVRYYPSKRSGMGAVSPYQYPRGCRRHVRAGMERWRDR